jgi:hypothetical protein
MLLLPKISGSSGFYKGPRTLQVLGPLKKLLLPLIFGSNLSFFSTVMEFASAKKKDIVVSNTPLAPTQIHIP